MKTTVDIPDEVLKEAIRHTGAATKREAIVVAMEDFNRRKRMLALLKHAGTCADLLTVDELKDLRRRG